jgi:hypothetical protein
MLKLLRKIRSIFGSKILQDNRFVEFWWDFWTNIVVFFETIKRFFFWGWKLKKSFEWDSHYLLEVMLIKMKEMHDGFEKYGCGVWCTDPTSEDYVKMKSLKLCIKLLERISKDEYFEKHCDILDEKYGEFTTDFEPIEGSKNVTLVFKLNGIDSKEVEGYHEEMRERMEIADRRKNRDFKIFSELFQRDIFSWWD